MHMLTNLETWEKLKGLGIEEWIAKKKASGEILRIGFSYHGNTKDFCELVDAYDWDFCMIQYNYLDENSGERWCLNAKDGWFGCGKIIGSCYYSTIAAVHILTTLWSTSYAATLINGCLVREKDLYQMDQLCAGHTVYEPAGDTAVGDRQSCFNWTMISWVHRNPDLDQSAGGLSAGVRGPGSDAVVSGCLPFWRAVQYPPASYR